MATYYLQENRAVRDLGLLMDIFGHDINIYKLYLSSLIDAFGHDMSVYKLHENDKDRPVSFQLSEPFVIVSHSKKAISLFQFEDAPISLMHCMFDAVSILFELYPDYVINDTTTSNKHYLSYLESIEE